MDSREIKDRLEAARPNSDDLSQKELREAAQAVDSDPELARQFDLQLRRDGQISRAMHEVSAPANFADRLLAQLATAESTAGPADNDIAAPLSLDSEFTSAEVVHKPAPIADKPARPTSPFSRSRRRLTTALLGLAGAILLAVMVGNWLSGSGMEVSHDQFQQQALSWKAAVRSDGWQTKNAAAIVAEYPIDRMLDRPRSYQLLDSQLADATQVVVYDYAIGRHQAYLFAAKTEYRTAGMNLQGIPPAESEPLSAGWRMAAWREGPLLYVLLHTGGPQDLDRFVRTPGAIASHEFSRPWVVAFAQ